MFSILSKKKLTKEMRIFTKEYIIDIQEKKQKYRNFELSLFLYYIDFYSESINSLSKNFINNKTM